MVFRHFDSQTTTTKNNRKMDEKEKQAFERFNLDPENCYVPSARFVVTSPFNAWETIYECGIDVSIVFIVLYWSLIEWTI